MAKSTKKPPVKKRKPRLINTIEVEVPVKDGEPGEMKKLKVGISNKEESRTQIQRRISRIEEAITSADKKNTQHIEALKKGLAILKKNL